MTHLINDLIRMPQFQVAWRTIDDLLYAGVLTQQEADVLRHEVFEEQAAYQRSIKASAHELLSRPDEQG
jgi:hypothetical protein